MSKNNDSKTSKKHLSEKKTARQTISISPALKEWISRYVNVQSRENPDDARFSSVSSFYTYVMEKVMENFKKGKDIEDFDSFVESEIYDFYDKFSFKATIPFYEMVVKTNRYTNFDISNMLKFFISYRKFLFENIGDKEDVEAYRKFLKRLQPYFEKNKLAKVFSFELDDTSDSKYPIIIFETIAYYENLIFENIKFAAGVLGIFGLKIIDFFYSQESKYSLIKAKATPLFYLEGLEKKERIDLYEYNISFITNFKRVLNDKKDYYLWMKLASDPEIRIHFTNKLSRNRWMRKIEDDLQKFGNSDEIALDILKYFDKLHWISLDNESPTVFSIQLPKEEFKEEREFILNKVSKYANIVERDNRFYFE
jgi:hypothetical protein